MAKGLSGGGTRIEFVTGPSLARVDVENRTEKADLMAEPEKLPPARRRHPTGYVRASLGRSGND